jgi:hypothetical protein
MHICPQELAALVMLIPVVRVLWLKIRARIA